MFASAAALFASSMVSFASAAAAVKLGVFKLLWNSRSAYNKIDKISEMMTDLKLHVLAITEKWHENSDCVPIKQLFGRGYNAVEVV